MYVLCRLSVVTALSCRPLYCSSHVLSTRVFWGFLAAYSKIHSGYFGRKEFNKEYRETLARWLSCLEHRSVHQEVVGSVPSQGAYLGRGFDPWSRCVWEITSQCFSFSSIYLSLSPASSSLPLFPYPTLPPLFPTLPPSVLSKNQ